MGKRWRDLDSDDRYILQSLKYDEAASFFGVSIATINVWRRRLGISRVNKARRIPVPDSLSKEAAESRPISDTALEYGVSVSTARRWMNELGCKTRNYVRAETCKRRRESERNCSERWSFYAPAFVVMTDAEVARALRVSRERIRQVREKYGWPCARKFSQARPTWRLYEKRIKRISGRG